MILFKYGVLVCMPFITVVARHFSGFKWTFQGTADNAESGQSDEIRCLRRINGENRDK